MKGSTHLIIGLVVGGAAACYYPPGPVQSSAYVAAAALSALAPDLDGTNMLSAKLGGLSRAIHRGALVGGVVAAAAALYLYATGQPVPAVLGWIGIPLMLVLMSVSSGTIRNGLVSLVGIGLAVAGYRSGETWLIGLGAYTAWAPWLKHRGMTHTVWALAIWYWLGRELETERDIPGIAIVAAAGYASHLVADTLTSLGVKWLYPLYRKSIKLPFF
ncbi:metal-dependent hydrolase [Cohnella rhizosphaerae]|uniref:Metal-dependent hydrolase n=1 Tax=Cohnella rhizosphaerae TaxID=1457232 RepID=A0A9X4QVA0_9BACL|nr:metal-dependent hydrolase [Cohnella rhizosphaerae]MDG0812545.1 metal-dependent hydrolase [Cohnella rhizosphaerae]